MEKPRVNYSEFRQAMKATNSLGAVLIDRYIREMDELGKPVIKSSDYCLRRLQREPICAKRAEDITKQDVIEHVKLRKAAGVCPATAMKDLTHLVVIFKHARSAWDVEANVQVFADAKPLLLKVGLIGKSEPRSRRPTEDEIARLLAYFEKQNWHHRTKVDMVLMTHWQRASARRVGESCKLLWADWDREAQTIIVRGMKDPRSRTKVRKAALPSEAQAILVALLEKRDPLEPRIFPYSAQTVSARYTEAKKTLGIENLHLHDSRRDCASRLAEKGLNSNQIRLVTQHETNAILDRTYNRPDAATFKQAEMKVAA